MTRLPLRPTLQGVRVGRGTMNLQPLRHFWHPVALASEVADRPVASTLLDQQLVLFRTAEGVSACDDLCTHRGTPLSLGGVEDNFVVCADHGCNYSAH